MAQLVAAGGIWRMPFFEPPERAAHFIRKGEVGYRTARAERSAVGGLAGEDPFFFAAVCPPLRPAFFFWARGAALAARALFRCRLPCRLLRGLGSLAMRAARSFDMPLSFRASYCFSFLTFADLLGTTHLRGFPDADSGLVPRETRRHAGRGAWCGSRRPAREARPGRQRGRGARAATGMQGPKGGPGSPPRSRRAQPTAVARPRAPAAEGESGRESGVHENSEAVRRASGSSGSNPWRRGPSPCPSVHGARCSVKDRVAPRSGEAWGLQPRRPRRLPDDS